MKKFGLTCELVHLDLAEILANYRKPKFWKNKWCVFKTKDFECIWKMTSIDLVNNTISSKVTLHYKGKRKIRESWWDNCEVSSYCDSVPVENPEYNQNVFNRNILGSVLYTINYLEEKIIKNTYEYKEAERLESDERDRLEEIANDFLDDNHVTNEEIREAYVDHYVSHASKYSYTNEVKAQAPRKYYPTARLMACSWFDNKKMFDAEQAILAAEGKKIKKKIIYQIWKSRKELEGDDFISEAEDQLEGI